MASETTFFTGKGDLSLPITSDSMDLPIGQNTPQNAVVNDLTVNGSATLPSGAITQAAVVDALQNGLSTFVLDGATPVTVTDAAITSDSVIVITLKTPGGTVGPQPHVETITPGTGFEVVGNTSDSSTYNYLVIG